MLFLGQFISGYVIGHFSVGLPSVYTARVRSCYTIESHVERLSGYTSHCCWVASERLSWLLYPLGRSLRCENHMTGNFSPRVFPACGGCWDNPSACFAFLLARHTHTNTHTHLCFQKIWVMKGLLFFETLRSVDWWLSMFRDNVHCVTSQKNKDLFYTTEETWINACCDINSSLLSASPKLKYSVSKKWWSAVRSGVAQTSGD